MAEAGEKNVVGETERSAASSAAARPVRGEDCPSAGPSRLPDGVRPPALEARDLTLSWDGEHIVVQGVDVTVAPGEVCCLVGRSGCGKTTILHALAGLTTPMAGRVLLHGEDLLPSRRIIDNVCLPLVLAGMRRDDARAKAEPLFDRFGLAGCERKWPSELSGGMRQRAAFLRTYLMGADVTLLDEPFSALDALTRTDVRRWFVDVAAELGLSALVITHDVDEAVSMASRIYVLAGAPAAGEPSHVAGIVTVNRVASESFELTDEYLAAKREVMALLG